MRSEVGIDWHGHNDRGLGAINNLRAIEAGADRVHGTALGIGERVGNAALDQTLMNLKLMGELGDRDLTKLVPWCRKVAEALGVPIPPQYPLVGDDAFRTATGVHAAAVIKAIRKGDAGLADRVYSGVPAGWFGKQQAIEIGFMSGEIQRRVLAAAARHRARPRAGAARLRPGQADRSHPRRRRDPRRDRRVSQRDREVTLTRGRAGRRAAP